MTTACDLRSASYYGVAAESADNSPALLAWLTYMAANGGKGRLDVVGAIRLQSAVIMTGNARPFTIVGEGRDASVLTRASALVVMLRLIGMKGVAIEDIGFDGGFAEYPTNASHGITVADCDDFALRRARIINWKSTAALVYSAVAFTHYNNIVEDSECDGGGVALNGWFIGDLDRSGIRRSLAKGCKGGSPGYGLQLKNRCRWSFIENSFVEECNAGVALGQDLNALAHELCRVSNVTVRGCTTAVISGYARNTTISGLIIDHTGQTGYPIDLQNSVGLNVSVNYLQGVAANRSAVYFRAGTTESEVHIGTLRDHPSANIATFQAGSARCRAAVDHWVGKPAANLLRGVDAQMTVA